MNASGMQQELDSSGKNRECVEARLAKESIVIDKSADLIDCGVAGSKDVSSEEHLLSPTSLEGSLERNCIKGQNLPPTVPDLETGGGQDEKLHGSESCLEAQSAHKGTFREAGLGIFEVIETVFDFNRGKSKEKGHVLDTAFPEQLLESWKKDPCPRLPLISEAKDGQADPFRVNSLSQQTRWKAERTCSNDCVSGRGDNDLALTGVGKGTDTSPSDTGVGKGICPNKSIKTNVLTKPCFVLLKDIGCEIKAKRERDLIQPNVTKLPQETQRRKKTVIKEPKVILCDIMKRGNVVNLQKSLQMQKDAKENQKKKSCELNNSANIPCSEEADRGETNLVYDGQKIESKACSRDTSSFCDVGIFTKLSNYINSHINENVKGSLQVDSAPFPDTQKTSFTEAKTPKVSAPQMGASFALPDEADLSESACESQSCILSLRSGDNLKFDTKDTALSKIQSQMPIEPCPLTEEVIQKQVGVTEVERLKQSNSEDDCWFLLEIDEIIEVEDTVCVTDEDNLARERDCGDVPLSPGNVLPQSEIDSGCEFQADDAEKVKKLTKNRTMELCGLSVKLLGTPTDNDERLNLGRLIDLEDASSDEANQGTHARQSANSRTEGKTYPVNTVWPKSSSSGGSRAKEKKTQEEPPATHPWLSQSQSRTYVVDALRKALQKRLDDSHDLNVQENTAQKLAERIERALFKLFCGVDQHYKTKFRSLHFNLKSTDEVLFRKVVLGDITPKRLVQMTSLELAPKELAEWRVSENKRALEVIEREEHEAQRSCPTKFTHKGIVEIHREVPEDLALQEIHESQALDSRCEAPRASERNPSVKHLHHTSDSACSTSTKQKAINSQKGFVPSHIEKREKKCSKRDQPNSPCLYGEERSLPGDSIPKKHSRTEKQPRSTIVWNGLIEMFSLKQFAAKAYPVSGSISHLTEALPLLLQSRGSIRPEDVWVYLDSMWPASSKEMGIIRFCPSLAKSHNPYNMLYSYLNNKQRYGIVKASQMEMFMVSLAAFQPLPSKLHKLGGPGLDPCHPSLLLGLILPKRTPTCILVTRPSPLPNAQKKKVTFKDSTETKCPDPPSHLPVETRLAQPPKQLPMPGLPCENEGPQDPLVVDDLCTLSEEVAGAMSSSTHCENTADCTNPSSLGSLLQSLSSYSWIEGQNLGTLEPQPYQTMYPGQFGMDSDPSYPWYSLGFQSVYPNQYEAFDTMYFPNQLCAEAAPSHEVSPASWLHQIPCATSEPPNSIMEETLALIQRVSELQPHLQSQPMMPTAVGLPATPQEDSSTLPQDGTGLELPPDQQDNDMFAQLQLLLSTLGGQAQPPSAI